MAFTQSGQINVTLNSYELYLGVVILGILSAVLGFVTHTVPSWVGYAGIAASVVVFFGYLADEFIPQSAGEYVVVTVIAAVVGVLGSLTGIQYINLIAVLTWVVAILGAIYNSVSEHGGAFLNSQQSTLFIGVTGAALAFFTWWLGDPAATTATVISTLVTTIGQFLRVSTVQSIASAKAGTAPASTTG